MSGKIEFTNEKLYNIGKQCIEIRIEWENILIEAQGLWFLLSGKYNRHITWASAGYEQQAGTYYFEVYGSIMPQLGDLKLSQGINPKYLLLLPKCI